MSPLDMPINEDLQKRKMKKNKCTDFIKKPDHVLLEFRSITQRSSCLLSFFLFLNSPLNGMCEQTAVRPDAPYGCTCSCVLSPDVQPRSLAEDEGSACHCLLIGGLLGGVEGPGGFLRAFLTSLNRGMSRE
ncbi:unnamed protein product [Lota lota]